MTTALDCVNEARRYLFAGQRETMNVLSGSHNNSTTTFQFVDDLGQIQPGAYLSIDLEIMYVRAVNVASKQATVLRAMLGSTAASHSDGIIAYVNSKFPAFSIFQALNADLDDLCAPTNGLYKLNSPQLTYNPAVHAYDITGATDILDVLRVRSKQPGPSKNWFEVRRWALKRNADTTIFPSGFEITLYDPAWPGLPFEVIYSSPFSHFTDLTTTCASVGLPTTANDLPALGAAARLTAVRETQRNFNESQGDTRRASEVPPGAQLQGYRALMDQRQRRIRSEADKLSSSYPNRRQG